PDWLFNWHVLLVAIGIFLGLRHSFRGGAWLILIMIGGFFMIQDYYPDTHINRFISPGVLIFVGLMIILRPGPGRRRWGRQWRDEEWYRNRMTWRRDGRFVVPNVTAFADQKESYSSEDYIDATSIFGGVHKKVVSKNFRGGDITTFMGGTEIDLTQADFT